MCIRDSYSYARLCSIIRKSELSEEGLNQLIHGTEFMITHPHERTLALTILKFPEVLDIVTDELAIHKLCDLIYDVAVKVAEGYSKYRILNDPNTNTRILLILAARDLLEKAFYLVGIKPLEKI
eukprot:TRINITY_DN1696_c0_g1_i3.p2 TRINITY_DN1696_c0_g1~~TRINITY_DN1696_c0_g1_i3.p2  ORF type:complete len:124 (+),score=17.12 TRINITY_DN1696_c0_g1_i3:67-438(+)